MRTVRAVGYGLVLLAAGAGSEPAQEAGGINFPELFQQLDANGDMVIEPGEVPTSGRDAFEGLVKNGDTNKDGKIDREEYRDMVVSLRDLFGPLRMRFAEVDQNGDGKISKDEYRGGEPLFARIDADGDGLITKDEAAKFQPPQAADAGARMIADRILKMDRDGDGKVSRDGFAGIPANFARWDSNKDGFITLEEAARMAQEVASRGGAAAGQGAMADRLKAMDRDGDGKISKDEFRGPAQLFDRLDTNSDGFLSSAEWNRRRLEPGKAQGKRQRADANKL
jgi:Ca2+-binding EF-hand superfamily protein